MTRNTRQSTLKEVADFAGVSSATVSRFFNNPEAVAEKTANRIRKAVIETGYTPNMVAGSLASNKSRLVSVLIPQLSHFLFIETIEALVSKLSAMGNVVTVGVTEFDRQITTDLIRSAMSLRAKAIVITAAISEDDKKIIRQSNMNAIEIWDIPDDPIDVAIGFSHHKVGTELARFVKSRGYVRPHVITNAGPRAEKRRNGFVEQWQKSGGEKLTETHVELPVKYGHARSAFAEIRRLKTLPDVIICGSDTFAQGLIIEAKNIGLSVPEDIAVIGFGNNSMSSEMRPTITSVDVNDEVISQNIIDILEKKEKNVEISNRIIDTGFKIIARESA